MLFQYFSCDFKENFVYFQYDLEQINKHLIFLYKCTHKVYFCTHVLIKFGTASNSTKLKMVLFTYFLK
jgi:hypothetical protein